MTIICQYIAAPPTQRKMADPASSLCMNNSSRSSEPVHFLSFNLPLRKKKRERERERERERLEKEMGRSLEEVGKYLNPFLFHLKKMELELTCPSCSNLLNQPMRLPCSHIVCSICPTTMNKNQLKCPLCASPFLEKDLKHSAFMEEMLTMFKNMNDDLVSISKVAGLEPRVSGQTVPSEEFFLAGNSHVGMDIPLMRSPALVQNIIDIEDSEGSYLSGVQFVGMEVLPVETSASTLENCSGSLQDSRADQTSNADVRVPPYGCSDLAWHEQDFKGLHVDNGVLLSDTDSLIVDVNHSENANLAKSSMSSPVEASDIREERQKWNHEHGTEAKQKTTNNHRCDIINNSSSNSKTRALMKCAFCHLSSINKVSGPMLHYMNEKPAREEVNHPDVKHFHQKCFEWAPQAYFQGETAKNLEAELVRASNIKCSKCGKKGAALGCSVKSCYRSYHVPCAIYLPQCRWDQENFVMLCPSHSSCKLPCDDIIEFKWLRTAKRTPFLRNRSKSVEKIKARYSSAPKINNSVIPGQLPSITEEQSNGLWMAAPGVCSEWFICTSDLSTPDKVLLDNFASLVGVPMTDKWKHNVTHVIASTKHGACSRTPQVLMAILNGKWILTINWVKACMEHGHPVAEAPYEFKLDSSGVPDGPQKGRIRALKKEPKILAGLYFSFGDQFSQPLKGILEELILAAGATLIRKDELKTKVSSPESFYIVYDEDLPEGCGPEKAEEVGWKRIDEVCTMASDTGFKVVGHLCLLDTIAGCHSAAHLERGVIEC